MNTDASWPSPDEAWLRVLKIQTKLHQWAIDGPDRQFDDLYNLVSDPAFLVVAWERVRGNRGHDLLESMGCNLARSSLVPVRFLLGCELSSRPERFGLCPCGNG